MESFVLCLQDQLHDLQHKWMEFQKDWGTKKYGFEMPYKYTYMRFHVGRVYGEPEAEDVVLRHVFNDGRLAMARFAVWKIVPLLELPVFEIRCCIQWCQWMDLTAMGLKTMDTRIELKSINGFDTTDMFVDYITNWIPTHGCWCRAWRRSSLQDVDVDTMFSSLETQQSMFHTNWSPEALRVWLWVSVEE